LRAALCHGPALVIRESEVTLNTEDRSDVRRKGREIVEGDEKHRTGRGKKRASLSENCGLGFGYGGYSVEQDQAKSQTGTADHVKEGE
jgi:hypothetical protein